MSTLRVNNIEAKSVPASPTIDEKIKLTNSSGDEVDPVYGDLFRESTKKGLLVIPCCFSFYKDHVTLKKIIPLLETK